MLTITFFDRVLPRQGFRCLGVQLPADPNNPARRPLRQLFFNNTADLAAYALKFDARGETVYHACSTFVAKDGGRKQANAGWMRAFWCDVDVGDDKGYPTQVEALRALKAMLAATGLPQPLIVSSGVGLHLYWPLDDDVTREAWEPAAALLKAVLAHVGFKADPTRTADAASVLRPVGTHHRKGETAREVKVVRDAPEHSLADIKGALEAYAAQHDLAAPRVYDRSRQAAQGINAEYMSAPSYAASDIRKVVKACQQVAQVVKTQGDCSYDVWRLTIGLGKVALADDEAKARKFAQLVTARRGATGHANTDWQTRFDTWGSGPPTCEKFREANPDGCKGCPFKVMSPIRLGEAAVDTEPVRATPAVAAEHRDALAFAGVTLDTTTERLPFPSDFKKQEIPGRSLKGLVQVQWKKSKNDDGEDVWESSDVPFCATVFFPIARLDGADEGAGMTVEMWVRLDDDAKPVETRRFTLAHAAISDTSMLLRELAKHEIVPCHPSQGTIMKEYLNAWIDTLRQHATAVRSLSQMGWTDDGFLAGNMLLKADATAQQVTLRGMADDTAKMMTPKGSHAVWHDVVHTAYNHTGQEHYQFMVTLGFAAPLFSLFNEYGGATVFAHSQKTGRGKTTAQRAALSVWGNPKELMLSEGKATANYLWRYIGTLKNLPIGFDELTNLSNEAASDLVFSISAGAQRRRLKQDGTPQQHGANWETILLASGNTSLVEKLALHRADASAEMARVFEFTVPDNSPLSVTDANNLFPKLIDNHGWAGVKFAAYLARNREAVRQALSKVRDRVNADCNITQSERYWAAVIASALTALHICRGLGLLEFSLSGLKQWLYDRLEDNRQQLAMSVASENEVFGEMMRDLWSGMLVTDTEGDLRRANGEARILHSGPARGPLLGRYIVGEVDSQGQPQVRSRLEISVRAMKDWCNKRGVSAMEIHRNLVALGYAAPRNAPAALGRGTRGFAAQPQVRCMIVYPDAWSANSTPTGTQLRAIAGGLIAQSQAQPQTGIP